MTEPVLKVRDLCVDFSTEEGTVRAVDHLNFDLMPGETLGVIGANGSGGRLAGIDARGQA